MKQNIRLLIAVAVLTILLVALKLLSTAGPGNPDRPETATTVSTPELFWDWFRANRKRIDLIIDRNDEQQIGDLCTSLIGPELRKVNQKLQCSIGYGNGKRELVISAESDLKLFPAVLSLTKAAPDIPGWTITAFRPRSSYDDGLSIVCRGQTVNATDIWFDPKANHEEKRVMTMLVKGLTAENREERGMAAFILLEHVVGEFDFATKIAVTSVECAPDDTSNLMSLRELSKALAGQE